MATNAQKVYFGRTINRFAELKVRSAMFLVGRSLPCSVVSVSGSIVTVQFLVKAVFTIPNVTVPIIGPEYIRYPIQPGCLGKVQPADAYIGNVTGLGSSAPPSLVTPANLSALCFVPLGNKNWTAPDDPNATVIYGPNGVILRDSASQTKIVLTPSGIVFSDSNGNTMTFNASGITINGVVFDLTSTGNYWQHMHSDVQTGIGDSGPVVPGT